MTKVTSLQLLILTAATLLLSACAATLDDPAPIFDHGVASGPKPWTQAAPNYDSDAVRFAVFSDLTGGEREGVFQVAVEQMNLLRPELIVNVGDLIEGSSDRSEIDAQWQSFDDRANKANAPVLYTGGNHDLLDGVLRKAWEERNGPRYYHVRYRDVLFLILDTEDHSVERLTEIAQLRLDAIEVAKTSGWDAFAETEYAKLPEDETGMISAAQAEYMRDAIAENTDVRWTFLLAHKAPWANDDMASWQSIEEALGEQEYTVFHGHRHSYQHKTRKGRDYIRLATTGGVFLPESGLSMDQIVWVTVDAEGAHIANLKMSGILDKTGKRPLNGDALCLDSKDCPEE
ncbi:metallophosphoesterase family protein [Congregibacter sp.]|uniref:metallophosphoesterase family protein n=1 Tax=Congregibacter sp. TaxID=2744308 RepID=UPI00385C35B1